MLECKIGKQKYQKTGNKLAKKRGQSSKVRVPRSFLTTKASHVVCRRPSGRGIAKEAPLPIWCSVRLPLNPLEFNGLWAHYVSAESRERETRLRNLKVRVRERKYTFIILLLLALLLSTFSASAVGIIRQIR